MEMKKFTWDMKIVNAFSLVGLLCLLISVGSYLLDYNRVAVVFTIFTIFFVVISIEPYFDYFYTKEKRND